ncbi:MAG: TonB-dependent receptor [Phenylobacterium sp.]|nr:TonB-dependent receptor [Phenylobacterium sp.]
MNTRIRLLGGVMSLACMLAAGQAAAQPAPAAGAAVDNSSVLGEVVVTARRRSESVQDVPAAITAFDQQALTQKAVSTPYDVAKLVPGLAVNSDSGNPALPNFSVRGRGQNYGAASGSVETYFADVPLSSPFQMPQLPAQFFDLQSFQVLKGPQGTLFGRNTTGGAVVIVPQAPTNVYGGYLRLQAGDFADKQAEGAINLPIVADKVLLRVAGFIWQRHGYGKTSGGFPDDLNPTQILPPQDFNNENVKEVRASLLVRPIDNLTNTTILTYHWDKLRASSGAGLNAFGPLAVPGSVALPTVPGQPTVYRSPGYGTYGMATTVDLNKPATKTWAAINTTTYDLTTDLTIKNIFGFIRAKGYTNDAQEDDGTVTLTEVDLPLIPRPRKNEQLTDELQLQGKAFDGRLTYTVGGLLDQTFEPGGLDSIPIASLTVSGSPFVPGSLAYQTRFQQNRFKSKAIYGAGTFKITDQLNFSAGYRYSWDDIYSKQGSTAASPVVLANATPAELTTFFRTFSGPTYNADLEWRPTLHQMIYGGYRHGYKRGGFNSSIPIPSLASFAPEKVDDFFLGAKNDFTIVGMPARLNVEGFYDKYKGQQVSFLSVISTPENPFEIIAPTTNVPQTKYYGIDMDFLIDPTKWLTLNGAYTYLHSKNGRWPDTSEPGSTLDLSVNKVVYSPKNKYAFTARFHTELPNGMGEVALAPTVSHQDKSYSAPFNTLLPLAEQIITGVILTGAPTPVNFNQSLFGGSAIPAYTLVDLRLEWNHVMGSKVDLAAQVTNLTNKWYIIGNGGTLPIGAQAEAFGAPRMFFVEMRTSF